MALLLRKAGPSCLNISSPMALSCLSRSPLAAGLAFSLATAPVYGGAPVEIHEPDELQASAAGSGQEGDKSRYHLFNPTPRELMRPLSADRPDKIESPHTVDAGHFQIETDFASWTENWDGDERTRTWGGPTPNVKVGLLNNLDLEGSFDTFLSERGRNRAEQRSWKRSGVGDTEVRLKLNVLGNDEGRIAAAVLPYVHLPTSRTGLGSSRVEGGLILPLAVELPGGWDLGLQVAAHVVEGEESPGYEAQFDQAIGLGHDIVGKLAGYLEFYSAVPTEQGRGWVGTVDIGLTYKLTDDIQLDCGVNIGVSPAADDWNPSAGITVRF